MNCLSTLNCSGTMTEILLEGLRETIGIPEQESLEGSAWLFEKFSDTETQKQKELFNFLEAAPLLFGERGAFGIAHRIGEASFRCFLKMQGKFYALTENSYRLMNSHQRIDFGLKKLADFAQQNCGAKITIRENEKKWIWQVIENEALDAWNRLYSLYTLGLLREFFVWTSGGRYYPMEETSLSPNSGILFQIEINKQPLSN
ncbi:MAG: hypothetical protein RBT01_14910 [Anaerolineaceae bacterium]|nr:hypothetical protein [Anaerolineaceae bacterium]